MDARYGMVLEEARASLQRQQTDLAAVRAQAASLLSFAGVAAAFLGGLALRNDAPLERWTYASALAFCLVAASALFVLTPRTWIFSNDAARMLRDWRLEERTPDDTAKHLAGWLAQHAARNRPKLKWLTWAYTVGIAAFAAEVLFLFLDLRGRT